MAKARVKNKTAQANGFYSLAKEERIQLVDNIKKEILQHIINVNAKGVISYFSDDDTYIRKSAYQAVGKIYYSHKPLQRSIIVILNALLQDHDFKVRQTVVNAAGEIGRKNFESVVAFFDKGLFDAHHSVRNAVIGSVKKMGEVNTGPVLTWARQYLHHQDKEIRREICHGIELRGRTHPEDILPLLKELEWDATARVKNTLVHVIGQITYKEGCLEKVVAHLKSWENSEIVVKALDEIIDVHQRYKNFAVRTPEEAQQYIRLHFT